MSVVQDRVDFDTMLRLMETADYVIPFAIRVAGDFKVADHLVDGPLPVAELARRTGTHAPSLERVLRALTIKDIFTEVEPGVFGLTPMAELLTTDHPDSLQGTFPLMPADIAAWARTIHSIRTGETAFEHVHGQNYYDYFATRPEDCARFDRSVQTLNILIVRTLLPAYPWGAIGTLVDVGSGTGDFTAQVLVRNPATRAILFDLPHVVPRARPIMEKAGVGDRCEYVAGDFFTEVPPGADVYLLKTILHDWDDARAGAVLRTVRAAMRPDSRVVVLESVPLPGDEYDIGKVMDIKQLVLFGGYARSRPQFEELFAAAGLALTSLTRTPTMAVIEGRPA